MISILMVRNHIKILFQWLCCATHSHFHSSTIPICMYVENPMKQHTPLGGRRVESMSFYLSCRWFLCEDCCRCCCCWWFCYCCCIVLTVLWFFVFFILHKRWVLERASTLNTIHRFQYSRLANNTSNWKAKVKLSGYLIFSFSKHRQVDETLWEKQSKVLSSCFNFSEKYLVKYFTQINVNESSETRMLKALKSVSC